MINVIFHANAYSKFYVSKMYYNFCMVEINSRFLENLGNNKWNAKTESRNLFNELIYERKHFKWNESTSTSQPNGSMNDHCLKFRLIYQRDGKWKRINYLIDENTQKHQVKINGSQTKKKNTPIQTIENLQNPNKLNFTQAKCDLTIFCICPNEFVSRTFWILLLVFWAHQKRVICKIVLQYWFSIN